MDVVEILKSEFEFEDGLELLINKIHDESSDIKLTKKQADFYGDRKGACFFSDKIYLCFLMIQACERVANKELKRRNNEAS